MLRTWIYADIDLAALVDARVHQDAEHVIEIQDVFLVQRVLALVVGENEQLRGQGGDLGARGNDDGVAGALALVDVRGPKMVELEPVACQLLGDEMEELGVLGRDYNA